MSDHAYVVSSRWWEGDSRGRSVAVEAVAFVIADFDKVGQFVAVRVCGEVWQFVAVRVCWRWVVDENWWMAVAVEDVTWCGEIGVVAEEALD